MYDTKQLTGASPAPTGEYQYSNHRMVGITDSMTRTRATQTRSQAMIMSIHFK